METIKESTTIGDGAAAKAANTAKAGNSPKSGTHSRKDPAKGIASRAELVQIFQQAARNLQASGMRVEFAESEKRGGRLLIAVYGAGVCVVCGNWIAGECWNPDCEMYQKPQIPQEDAA